MLDPEFDYLGNVQRLGAVMQALESVDLAEIVSVTEHAHTLGPFIDPTLYRDALGRGDMDAMAELARALQPAVRVWREKIAPKIVEGHPDAEKMERLAGYLAAWGVEA